MSFSATWLSQREPYDHAARSSALAWRFAEAVGAGRVLDLGGGQGSGARYLREHGAADLDVWVVDHDEELLAHAAEAGFPTAEADLRAFDWPDADALHCQALLDLVSWAWLETFIERLVARPMPLLATLSVDGRVSFDPSDPDDEEVLSCFRAHQSLDRGFGPSPGPRAGHVLAQRLEVAGWTVVVEQADWQIPSDDVAMVRSMVDGIVEAAAHMSVKPDRIRAWGARRSGSMTVGHIDVLALPPEGRST